MEYKHYPFDVFKNLRISQHGFDNGVISLRLDSNTLTFAAKCWITGQIKRHIVKKIDALKRG